MDAPSPIPPPLPDFASLDDKEKGVPAAESLQRPVKFVSAVFVGLGMCLVIVLLLGFTMSNLIVECLMDGQWIRMAFVALIPLLMLVGLFFMIVIFTNIFQILGPIGGAQKNSRNYSAIKPNLTEAYAQGFKPPHITIQMPVYKEGLEGVIIPTVQSLKAAISHYESHGGTASIFINDDGMQLIDEKEAQARMDYYHDNNIGWVSRPKHNSNGFLRKGKFKKASNMNFALNVSQKVESYLQTEMEKKMIVTGSNYFGELEVEEAYNTCLQRVLRDDTRVWAAGNIRMGEYILIIDSDTRVVGSRSIQSNLVRGSNGTTASRLPSLWGS
jgi:hypothetical protein